MKLGEAMGAVLRSCVASQKPISSVQITTQGKVAAPNPLPAQGPPTGNASQLFCEVSAPSSGSVAKQALKSRARHTLLWSSFAAVV